VIGQYWKRSVYLVALLTFFMFLSHGTQDLYPDFLKTEHHFSAASVADIAVIYNIGAIVGAIIFGHLSELMGRRRSILAALALSFLMVPLWSFGAGVAMLTLGAFMMQAGVQGAWGIIPAHLNELSPDSVRGLLPGMTYQLGILFAAGTNTIEYALRDRLGYRWALASFEMTVILCLSVLVAFGIEAKGRSFVRLPANL
jgi:MFS transporter, SHS family, lactate transporter